MVKLHFLVLIGLACLMKPILSASSYEPDQPPSTGKKGRPRLPNQKEATGGEHGVHPVNPSNCRNGGHRCGWEPCCPGECTCTSDRKEDCNCEWNGQYSWK